MLVARTFGELWPFSSCIFGFVKSWYVIYYFLYFIYLVVCVLIIKLIVLDIIKFLYNRIDLGIVSY